MSSLDIILLIFVIIQQVIHHMNTQKLLNKIMSRNYQDYMVSQVIAEEHKAKDNTKIVVNEDEYDDPVGTMNRIGIL